MQISTEQLINFKQLYKTHFDIDLKDSEALELGHILVNQVRTILSNSQKVGKK